MGSLHVKLLRVSHRISEMGQETIKSCVKKTESQKLSKETHHRVSFRKDETDSFGVGLLLAIKNYSFDDTPQLRRSLNHWLPNAERP